MMIGNKNLRVLAVLLAGVLASSAWAQTMTKSEHSAAQDRISANYKMAHEKCAGLAGNAKDVCVTDAKAQEKIAKANLAADYKSTPSTRNKARIAKAEAEYAMAKERCNDKAGTAKDVCVQEAKTAEASAIADSKLKMKTTDASMDAKAKVDDAKMDADESKREAQLKLAKEKCESMAGMSKDNCMADANARHGKK